MNVSSRYMEGWRKDPNHNYSGKSIIPEIKNTAHEIKSRLDTAEDKISKIVDITIQTNQNETETKQDRGEVKRPSEGCKQIQTAWCTWTGVSKGNKREKRRQRIYTKK